MIMYDIDICCIASRAQKLLALAPNDPEDGVVLPGPPLDDEPATPSSGQSPMSAAAAAPSALMPHGAGPATCACWIGPSGRIFATGHASGEVVVWALPLEPKDAGAYIVSKCSCHTLGHTLFEVMLSAPRIPACCAELTLSAVLACDQASRWTGKPAAPVGSVLMTRAA